MITIGLTGGIASGKSTVSAELRQQGVPIFDADQNAKDAVAKGSKGLAMVVEAFGSEYLTDTGELNRPKVSELVFHDKAALKILESILHKIVWENAEGFLKEQQEQGAKLAVLDVPLLIETGWHKQVDKVWLVAVSRQQQIERLLMAYDRACDSINKHGAAHYAKLMENRWKLKVNTLARLPKEIRFERRCAPREQDLQRARQWLDRQ